MCSCTAALRSYIVQRHWVFCDNNGQMHKQFKNICWFPEIYGEGETQCNKLSKAKSSLTEASLSSISISWLSLFSNYKLTFVTSFELALRVPACVWCFRFCKQIEEEKVNIAQEPLHINTKWEKTDVCNKQSEHDSTV